MAVLDGRTWLDVLGDAECWRLLRLSAVGRLAIVGDDGAPEIWPVNIAVDGRSIVFRTDPGGKLAALLTARVPGRRVAIEVDGLDFDERRGWSVVARGRVREIGGADLAAARELRLEPWTAGEKARWFRVTVDQVTGREIGARAAAR